MDNIARNEERLLALGISSTLEDYRGQELLSLYEPMAPPREPRAPWRGSASPLMALWRRRPENRRLIAKGGLDQQSDVQLEDTQSGHHTSGPEYIECDIIDERRDRPSVLSSNDSRIQRES